MIIIEIMLKSRSGWLAILHISGHAFTDFKQAIQRANDQTIQSCLYERRENASLTFEVVFSISTQRPNICTYDSILAWKLGNGVYIFGYEIQDSKENDVYSTLFSIFVYVYVCVYVCIQGSISIVYNKGINIQI